MTVVTVSQDAGVYKERPVEHTVSGVIHCLCKTLKSIHVQFDGPPERNEGVSHLCSSYVQHLFTCICGDI